MNASPTASPADAVRAWWTAMQQQDVGALEKLTAEDYVSSGGPDGRTTDRRALIDQARSFFGEDTEITHWAIDDLTERRVGGSVAVCAYDWSEEGVHAGAPFAMTGAATDVLVRRDGAWVHQAHHVSLRMPPVTEAR